MKLTKERDSTLSINCSPELDEAAELEREYQTKMKIFKESDKGKSYFREAAAILQRKNAKSAKLKYLVGMPKKLQEDPKKKWMKANFPVVKREFPKLTTSELRVKLNEKFMALTEEEREKLNQERQSQKEAFAQSMKKFKGTPSYQKYSQVIKQNKLAAARLQFLQNAPKNSLMTK